MNLCGNCKHYNYCYDDSDNHCNVTGEFKDEYDTCDNWESDNEPPGEEQRENAGDIEAHRIMVEGKEIE